MSELTRREVLKALLVAPVAGLAAIPAAEAGLHGPQMALGIDLGCVPSRTIISVSFFSSGKWVTVPATRDAFEKYGTCARHRIHIRQP